MDSLYSNTRKHRLSKASHVFRTLADSVSNDIYGISSRSVRAKSIPVITQYVVTVKMFNNILVDYRFQSLLNELKEAIVLILRQA